MHPCRQKTAGLVPRPFSIKESAGVGVPPQHYDTGFLQKNQHLERKNMKKNKFLALLLALALTLTLCACAEKPTEKVELTVFAAASLQETLTTLGEQYMAAHDNVTIVFNFDSSGTLLTQIKEGAVCDLFLSAAPKQMNALDGSLVGNTDKNPDGLDMLVEGSRIDLLENKVALAVPEGNPAGIESFDQLALLLASALEQDKVLLAIGNGDVPVGQYTQKIFDCYALHEQTMADAGKLTYGGNVKEVTTQVSEAAVDCGIIYQTDAFSAGLTVVDTATAEMCGQVIYPAAVLKGSAHADEARAFLDYLTTDEADAVFEAVGFTPMA